MKIPLSWLERFLDTRCSLEEISHALTHLGHEVEEIIDRSDSLKDFTVAYINSTEPHPNATKLKVCNVETESGVLQIVCGAPNARAGIKVVYAKIGSFIPSGNFKIKESEIRGIKSMGMLCSESELMLGKGSDGIIELPLDAVIGENIAGYYGLDEPVLNINITPNRGDALGIYGIARELAAKGLGNLKDIVFPTIEEKFNSNFTIKIDEKSICPIYAIRQIKNIKNLSSPTWLKNLLQKLGITSVSSIVDITNYIAYSFSQPMHAYDADVIKNELIVGLTRENKIFDALDNKLYSLTEHDLVIGDGKNIYCLAGIIGGRQSKCSDLTNNIILEAAIFDPINILTSGRRLQIDTDSKYRFERGVDPEFTLKALNIATAMILEICGGEASQIILSKHHFDKKTINFSSDFLEKISGIKISNIQIENILSNLGFDIKIIREGIYEVISPSWRHDIKIAEDIVEEIIRIYGYENIPKIPLSNINTNRIIDKEHQLISNLKRAMAICGYDEVVTWSFMKDTDANLFAPINAELLIINPISNELNYLRPSIVPNLLKLLAKNQARGFKDLAFLEIGPIFQNPTPEGENTVLTAIKTGVNFSKDWRNRQVEISIFDIKADLESILDNTSLDFNKLIIRNDNLPQYYHPTCAGSLNLGKEIIGYFGQIHPKILSAYDIHTPTIIFELNIKKIPISKNKFGLKSEFIFSDFQLSKRDFSFILNSNILIGEIINNIKAIDKKLIKDVELFDIYDLSKTMIDKKSISLSVSFQANDRTLTDVEINNISTLIINEVSQKFDGKLRE